MSTKSYKTPDGEIIGGCLLWLTVPLLLASSVVCATTTVFLRLMGWI